MMRIKVVLANLMLLFSCVHAQVGGIGGTGGIGGVGGVGPGNPRLTITNAGFPDGAIGTAYSQTLGAVNGVAPLSWTIAFGSLPPGLVLNSSSGVISGTPTTAGNFQFTVVVFDSTSPTAQTATKDMQISIACPVLSITSTSPLPPATRGSPYSFQFVAQGGSLPLIWTSGTVIPGLTLSSSGLLSGTPTNSGQVSANITVSDSCAPTPQSVTQAFALAINGVVTITTTSPLPNATVGQTYNTSFQATGGTAPYTWALIAGSLPGGLNLSGAGVISGTPTTAQVASFSVRATDSFGATNSAPFTITVACPPLTVSSTSPLPDATQNAPYRFQFVSNGGAAPVAWTMTAGTLPNGLSLNSAGLLSGTPTQAGAFTFTATATDSCSTAQTVGTSFTLTVGNELTITTVDPLPAGTVGQPYSAQVFAQGGLTPYTWSLPSGPVPNGAIDLLDYFIPANRATIHLTGATNKSTVLDAGMFWMLKGATGNPWDGWWYDDTYVYFGFTENNDSSQQAACIAAGYTSCFVDPFAYKLSTPGKLFTPRYFVPGSTVTLLSPPVLTAGNVNAYQRTTNCGADNQPILYLGNVKTVTSGPTNVAFGGGVGTQPTVEIDYYYSGNSSGVYQSRERFYLALGFGQVKWTFGARQSDGSYLDSQVSLNNNVVAGGAPTPNFACKVPTLPISGGLPAGVTKTSGPSLDMNSFTGVISGTPLSAGTSAMTVQVEDTAGTIAQKTLTIAISCPAFSITSASPLPAATQGSAYTFQFQTSGGIVPVSWTTAGTLPTGMTLSSSGVLSGTPTNFGSFLFTTVVTDSCDPTGQARQKTFSLTVSPNSGPLTISTASPLPPGTQGQPYSAQLQATGGTKPYLWAIASGTLPAGLSLSAATGIISGTPTTLASTSVTFRVTDAIATTTTKALSITVTCPALTLVSASPLPNGVQNGAFNFQFQASGGITPYTWTRTAGSFATGLSLSSAGALTGTITVSGSFSATVQVADSCSTPQTQSGVFAQTVSPAVVPLVITTTSPLPAGTVGISYGATMAATGGTQPYFWAITSGALPAGLTLNSNGTITGTPTTAQTTTPTIQVTDSIGATTSGVFSITIACSPLSMTTTSPLPNGTQGTAYSAQLIAAGGALPRNWTVISGTLPTGLTLSSAGLISGTPTGSGASSFTVQVADSCSTPQTVSRAFSLTIGATPVPLSITTTSPLPPATVGVSYNTTISATGGIPPYSNWIVSSGSLPSGLSLNTATGIISGTPSAVQVSTATIQVQDSAPTTTSKAFTITVSAATAADNRYCSTSETWIGPTTDGPALLPTKCVRTALSDTPASGPVKTVCSSGCDYTTFQAAATAASCGWIIKIKSTSTGTPTGTQNSYSGLTTIPATSCPATNWIIVETDQVSGLPAEGSRISPAWTGKATLPARPTYSQPSSPGNYLPQLINNGPVVTFTAGASHWRLIGLEVTTPPSSNQVSAINIGSTNHIILDRIVCHGGNSATWQAKNNSTRCVSYGGSTYGATIDSYMGDIHTAGGDTQPIYLGGTTTTATGPIKVVNNFLEGAGMCMFSGGGGNGSATLPSNDLEIRRNHCFKPLFWKSNDPTYFGTTFTVKNHIEFKNTQRALIEGNYLDTVWGGQSDQFGAAINIGPKNQSVAVFTTVSTTSSGAVTRISGTQFPSNVVSPTCAVPLHCRIKINGVSYQAQTWIDGNHITVSPVPPTSASVSATVFSPGLNPSAIVTDITVRYNKIIHASRAFGLSSDFSDGGDVGLGHFRDSFHDNIGDDIDGFHWTLPGGCCAYSLAITPVDFVLAPFNLTDLSYVHNTVIPHLSGGAVGFGPSIFNGRANSPMTSLNIRDNIGAGGLFLVTPTHTHSNALSDLQAGAPGFCFEGNVLAISTATSGPTTGTANNPPYPAAGQSPGCSSGIGNFSPATYNAIGFTNLNGANGGNYQLLNTSPYHNAASDGTDPGANIPLVNQYTAGVP